MHKVSTSCLHVKCFLSAFAFTVAKYLRRALHLWQTGLTVAAKRKHGMLAFEEMGATSEGHRLRTERRRLGLTQAAVAEAARLSRNTIIRAEGNDESLHPATLKQVSDALEALAESRAKGVSAKDAVRDIITSSGETPSDLFREFAAKMERRPINEQWLMAESFAIAMAARAGVQGEPLREQKDDE